MLVPIAYGQFADPSPSWTKYAPLNEEFSIETPATLGVRGDDKATSSRKYYGSVGGSYVYIFSDPVRSPFYFSTINRYLTAWKQETQTAEKNIRRISFEDEYGYTHQLLIVRTEARIYVVQAVAAAVKDSTSTRFIDSFTIGDQKLPVAEIPDVPDPTPGGVITPYDGTGGGIGTGSGQGMGSGSGFGILPAVPPRPKDEIKPFAGQTSALKILTKPRPSYTDLARFYEINGTVRLRVTFSGTGEIGAVAVVTSLPFGLAQQASDAARKITFEPEFRNGKGRDLVKAVEYTFSIY